MGAVWGPGLLGMLADTDAGNIIMAADAGARWSHRLLHHHIAGAYLLRYAQEASWWEDNRQVSNGDQVRRLAGLALGKRTSPDFVGYWQRHGVG